LQKNSLTMDELLDHLNMTAKVDCQEAQRAVLASTNGLAALDIINNDFNAAAEKVSPPASPSSLSIIY
jgi:hypothetical protein